jgi:hypothetical protein
MDNNSNTNSGIQNNNSQTPQSNYNEVNGMSIADRNEIPMAIESIANNSRQYSEPEELLNQKEESSFNQNMNPSPAIENTPTDVFTNPIEERAKEILQSENIPSYTSLEQKPSIPSSEPIKKEDAPSPDNKMKFAIVGIVVLIVIILGVGGFIAYNAFLGTPAVPEPSIANNVVTTPEDTLSKEEYLNVISATEIDYKDVKSAVVELFTKFSDATSTDLYNQIKEKTDFMYTNVSTITPPSDSVDFNNRLSSTLLNLKYSIEFLEDAVNEVNALKANEEVPNLNNLFKEIDGLFSEIKSQN